MAQSWNERADTAAASVIRRFVRQPRGLPVAWARMAWPPPAGICGAWQEASSWQFWWQAQLIDAAVDMAVRHRTAGADRLVERLLNGSWVRAGARWTNEFYDDIAWLALAAERAHRLRGIGSGRAVRVIADRLAGAWDPTAGALPWCVGSAYFNAPANGPAAIVLARTGRVRLAQRICDWIDGTLVDPETGLVADGVVAGQAPDRTRYTYCQGVAIGAETELWRRTADPRHLRRLIARIAALSAWAGENSGVLPAAGGGDGGLFAGITTRYLADAVPTLQAAATPSSGGSRQEGDQGGVPLTGSRSGAFGARPATGLAGTDDPAAAAGLARDLVLASAQAAWDSRAADDVGVVFSPDWQCAVDTRRPAVELSVQVGGWLALEAAASLQRNPV